MTEPIPLAAFIQQLRRELQTAIAESEGQTPRFEVQDLEIEVQVVAARDVRAACGGWFPPAVRFDALGFRLSRGRELKEPGGAQA